MKWIFAILLLINGLLVALAVTQQPARIVSSPLPEDIGDLKIVSDVDLTVRADYQKRQRDQLMRLQEEKQRRKAEAEKVKTASLQKAATGCHRIGSFDNKADAAGISAGLANYRVVSTVVAETLSKTVGYWALLPSTEAGDEGTKLIASLREAGFEDIRQLPSGEFANAISLGLFSNELNAVKQVRKAEKLGHVAAVTPKLEEFTTYWVEFDKTADFEVPMKSIKNAFPNVGVKACEVIAR